MKQVYQTRDGEIFEKRENAETHEAVLFDSWINNQEGLLTLGIQKVLDGLDDCDETEFFDTPKQVFIDILRGYFESHEECGQ
ncbi:MAG: hypothetical protein ACYS7Y_27415 [Planctomycetota bacterium]|jgi:hypothetical protein